MKSYIVFGCGKFGSSAAKTLSELGNEVMVVDINLDSIEEIADYVTTAIQCDVMDENATSEMGLKNFDAAVVAIGTNFEAAIMSTVLAKEAGIEYIVAKATSNRQALILKKLGADKIIFPERDMGVRVAHNLSASNLMDFIQLSPDYSIAEFLCPVTWVGKNLKQLNVRSKYKVTVLAIERGNDDIKIDPYPDSLLQEGDVLVLLGKDEDIKEIEKIKD
ncbi:potassium channel family protein [Peptoniphilus sp.]|uniref:potassium channel family protein n=1 Tax=Peptoniphilus sp. TaxID=1971214 RepID=UPI0039930243